MNLDSITGSHHRVAGVDEAGRGPLAGPVVISAVMLPARYDLEGLDDSKRLSENQRNILFTTITNQARAWGIGAASEQEIDELNILGATRLAGYRAFNNIGSAPEYLLLDALHLPTVFVRQRSVIKGDQLSISIAAASILAKVSRDRIMQTYHEQYPDYHFHI